MKQMLLAGLLILFAAERLDAGNIWPRSSSLPTSYVPSARASQALEKLNSTIEKSLFRLNIPDLPQIPSGHSNHWPQLPTGGSSNPVDCPDWSGLPSTWPNWPHGSIPSPWPSPWLGGSGTFEKIEDRYEDKFDDLSGELDDLIANVPDYADTDDYQDLVDDIEKLIDRHGEFVDRLDSKIEHITNAIDRTDDTIERLDEVLDRLQDNTHIPAKVMDQIEKQIERAKSRVEKQIDSLEAKKTALEEKLAEYGLFQSEIEDYLENVQNPAATPITTTALAAESVENSLAVSLNEAAAQASQTFAETTQQSTAASASDVFQAAALQSESTADVSDNATTAEPSPAESSGTFHSLASSALQSPTLEDAVATAESGESDAVQFAAGANLTETVSGGAAEVGGVDVTFESQAGGTFTSDYFQTESPGALAQSIGQTAFDKINFLLSDDLQGWELHFEGDFDGSAQIVLGYDDSILPAGIDESDLKIMHFNSLTGEWELPEGFMVDTLANQFHFSVNSFSPFVMTFDANVSANPEPSTGVIFSIGLLMLAHKRRRRAVVNQFEKKKISYSDLA